MFPEATTLSEIVLIRHAETDANRAGLWQGRGDSDLSAEGRAQVEALAARLGGRDCDVVVSSPLTRARHTAVAVGPRPEVDPDLVEIDLGEWEGRPFADVAREHGPSLSALYRGHDGPVGRSGERMSEVATRAWRAIETVAERVGPGGRAVVVTHGGVIDAVFSAFLPTRTRRPHRMASNTALTLARGEVTLDPGLMEIGVGYWEGLDMSEVRSRWPELARRIFDDGEDLPRGETGETWQSVTDRVVSAIGNLAVAPHPEGTLAAS